MMSALCHRYGRRLAALACTLATLALLALFQGVARAQDQDKPATDAASDAATDAASTGRSRTSALRTTQICIDQEIANRLAVKRKRRGAVDRLFIKQARHEITAMGGYYSSDLFSGTYVAGGSYTFHMTEDTAVEFGAAITHANADILEAIEDGRGSILDDDYARVLLVESLLVWSPVYGKLRLGGTIMRFDINLGAGVGVVDSQTSRGAAGVAGVGMKLFIGKALAVRIDARNHVFRQELLDERFLVNDVAVTTGLSLFLPLRN
jgi:outer membrane beta-barrel protein